ncbi:MAG TPA: MlaD family protein [Thermoanaerobaculia bacterium]|nr:MlaD family protein [Thermoanaerobaculia bacterium]
MSSAAKVGIFMLIVLAILAFFVLRIEDIRIGQGGKSRIVEAVFDTVAGLDKKSTVRVAGVDKGKVEKISLQSDGRARVRMRIENDVQLRKGATARIANLGLLGEKYIELDPGPARAMVLAETSDDNPVTLQGSQPASIDDVTSQVSAIANDVKAITESLRATVAGQSGQQRIEEIVENVRQITQSLRAVMEASSGNVTMTAANLRAITDDLRIEIPKIAASIDRVAGSLGGTVSENRGDVKVIVDNLRTLSADLKKTTENLNAITGQVKSGEGTVGKLIFDDTAHTRLTSTLESVESGVGELRNTLGRVNKIALDLGIKSDFYVGLDEDAEGNPLGSNSRSGVQLRLTPNPEKNRFYNVEIMDDPRGDMKDKVIRTSITDEATGATSTTTKRETKFERNYLLSAQAGWKFGDLDLRAGVIDSAGGVGADYLLRERIRVTAEAFDFGGSRSENPHLRVFGEYIFRKEKDNAPSIFLSSGVDNPLNDVAITFGGGIRWRDDDLKYLLGSIPIK